MKASTPQNKSATVASEERSDGARATSAERKHAYKSASGAVSLYSYGTIVPGSVAPENDRAELNRWRAIDPHYREAAEAAAQTWDARRRAMAASGDGARADYAAHRAASLRRPLPARARECETRGVVAKCGCAPIVVPRGCGMLGCSRCARRASRRWRKDLETSLPGHMDDMMARWRAQGSRRLNRPRYVMLTLTVRHSGDLDIDRRRIVDGWRGVYRWLHRRGIKSPYALAHEVTAGSDGTGHVHAHVVAIWPHVPYDTLRSVYLAATDGAGERLHVSTAKRQNASAAARYLAKYATKGMDIQSMAPRTAAQVLAAYYNKRKRGASHGFYSRIRATCPECCLPWCRVYGAELLWLDVRAQLAPHVQECLPLLE